jgi:hypothetical protein
MITHFSFMASFAKEMLKIRVETNHGASAVVRRIVDCNLWMKFIFVLLAHPRRSHPHIHIGLITAL